MNLSPPISNEPPLFIGQIPANRKQERLLFHETKRYMPELMRIEMAFGEAIFTSEKPYKEIYEEFKDKWVKYCIKAKNSKQVKYSSPNFEYFDKHFFPEEEQTEDRNILFGL